MRWPLRISLFRSGISRRIALALVLSLVAVQFQAFLQLRLLYEPQFRLVGTQWLVRQVEEATTAAFSRPPAQRDEVLKALPNAQYIERRWEAERPRRLREELSSPAVWSRLSATLESRLGPTARFIEVDTTQIAPVFPFSELRLTVLPTQTGGASSNAVLQPEAPDELIPGNVRIAVQGVDGTWVTVAPRVSVLEEALPVGPLTLLIAGGLCIALFTVLITRAVLKPLDRLVAAARRIGASRDVVPVPTEGLGEFAAIAQAIDDMQQRLLKMLEDRTIMLAAISHDLKSSLTRLRLAIELKSGAEMRDAADKELQDMQAMLDSTLAFATGDIQRGSVQPTDVATLLISLVDETTDTGANGSYSGPDHAETSAQPVALRRAFRNLIDNAVKYGGCARVTLQVMPEVLQVSVEDDGPGIDPMRIEEAFAPFRRLDPARSSEIPGAGLGLTIARDVLRNHGGGLTLGRAASGGLRVVVTLPRR